MGSSQKKAARRINYSTAWSKSKQTNKKTSFYNGVNCPFESSFIYCVFLMMMWSLSVFGCQADSVPTENAHFRALGSLFRSKQFTQLSHTEAGKKNVFFKRLLHRLMHFIRSGVQHNLRFGGFLFIFNHFSVFLSPVCVHFELDSPTFTKVQILARI